MPSNASQQFTNQIGYVDQLISIHAKLQTGKGRRHEQEAIHRAGVVMTVAAWESYIENVLLEGVAAIESNAGIGIAAAAAPAVPIPPWARHTFDLRRTEIKNSIKKFNTPNAVNVRDLFVDSLEFNPWLSWNWNAPNRQWNSDEMRKHLNQWLDIRHSVAHGFPLLTDIVWIQGDYAKPRLTLYILKDCKALFKRLVLQTDTAFAVFLRDHHGVPIPW
jgi:hypothetical protein